MRIQTDTGWWVITDPQRAEVQFSFTERLRGWAHHGLEDEIRRHKDALAGYKRVYTEEQKIAGVNVLYSYYARPGMYFFEKRDKDAPL